MNLLSRLVLLISLFFSVIGGGLWLTTRSARSAVETLAQEWQEDKSRYFENAVKLQGAATESVLTSYAWWPQTLKYIEAPTEKWAIENLDNLAGTVDGADALWVLGPGLEMVHSIDEKYGHPPFPLADPGALPQFKGTTPFRFFTIIHGQLWEIYGTAILDTTVDAKPQAAHGFLVMGKRWNENSLARLGALAGARLSLQLVAPGEPKISLGAELGRHVYHRRLAGADGRTLAVVTGQFDLAAADETTATIERQLLLAALCLLTALCAITVFLSLHVLRPLGKITRSLETHNPIVIADLLGEKTEFGEIARLLANQLRQGRMLQEEIRRHLASASPDDRRREAETNEALRLRLAGNLHDGPMQAIYAAGLQVSSLLASTRAVEPAKLESINTILSQANADLRNILLDLEPEELREQDLETAIHRLEQHMLRIGRCDFKLEIAEGCLDGLSREAQLHLYYIGRELVSNSLRHARPAHASLRYRNVSGFLHVDWQNDGVPSRGPVREGNGLRNIGHRVQELGGKWQRNQDNSSRWTVSIEVPYTSLANSAAVLP